MTANDSSLLERVRRAVAPRFRVDREVACGGMGVVFEARDTELTRRVALKLLIPEKASASAALRFVREARSQAQLRHPNIVTVHDTREADGLSFIIMEFVAGPTLQQVLKEKGPLPLRSVLRVGVQVASALEAAHARGIIHRDIKPSNIFLEDDRAMLADFGIAFSQNLEDSTITQDGGAVGTPDYMAPEQFGGEVVDARADIYSLGLVLREIGTGRNPRGASPSGKQVELPGEISAVLKRMIAPSRDDRPASAAAVRAALERAGRRMRLRKLTGILAASGMLLCAAVLWWWIERPPRPAAAPPVDLLIGGLEASDTVVGRRLAGTIERKLEWFPLLSVRRGDGGLTDSTAGVQYRLGGGLTLRGSSVEVDLAVTEASGRVHQRIRAQGDTADLPLLSCLIADSIVAKVFPRLHAEYGTFGCRRDPDIQAVNTYFSGADYFRRGRWAEAEQAFEEALQRDPGMMQAAWELMVARRYQRKDFEADLRWLEQRKDSLPPFYRALVEAQQTTDLHERFRRYEEIVRSSHGASKALLLYTNERYHRGPLIGRPIEPVVDTMAALAELHRDMQHTSTYDISIWGNVRLGRQDSAKADLERRMRLVGDSPDRNGPFQRFASWSRFDPGLAKVVRAWRFRSPSDAMMSALVDFTRLGTMFDIPETQIYLGTVMVANERSVMHGAVGRLAQGLGHIMLGQTHVGLDWIDSAEVSYSTREMELQRHEWPVMLSALAIPVARARVDDARAWLRTQGLEGEAAHRARAHWTLGMDALARNDSAEVALRLSALRTLGDTSTVAGRLASLLAASMLGKTGAFRAAIDSTRPIFLVDSVSRELSPFARAATYLGRGRWQRALGARDQADHEWLWYENSDYEGWPSREPQQGEVDAVLGVYARLLRGELATERRSPMDACRHLSRVRELWRGAEPAMDSLRARADSAAARARCP